MAEYDPTDWDLQVSALGDAAGDRIVSGFAGLDNYRVAQEVTPINGPGNRRLGFNLQRGANGVDFSISVFANDENSVAYLRDLARRQVKVGMKAIITRNAGTYKIGQLKALGGESGYLSAQQDSVGSGDEVDRLEFQFMGIGPVEEYFAE